jgi:hypothetical protein
VGLLLAVLLRRNFRGKKPPQSTLARIQIDEGNAGLGKLYSSPSQPGDGRGKVWLVPNQHENLLRKLAQQPLYICMCEARCKQPLLANPSLKVFCSNLGCFNRTRQRTREDQVWCNAEARQKFTYLMELASAAFRQGPFIVRFFPVRPISRSVAQEIKSHASTSDSRAVYPETV